MIQTYAHQKKLDEARIDSKTLETPGKPLKYCQLKRVTLTHISPKEDSEVRRIHGKGSINPIFSQAGR